MTRQTPIIGRIVLKFDVPLILEQTAYGAVLPAVLADIPARVHFPGQEGRLSPPNGFELQEFEWSYQTASRQALINALGFSFNLTAVGRGFTLEQLGDDAETPLERGFVRGWEALAEPTRVWLARFQELAAPVLRQLLTLEDPSPSLIMHPSDFIIRWVSVDDRRSRADPTPAKPASVSLNEVVLPTSERAADLASIERIVRLTNSSDDIPSSVRMLTTARIAAQRGRRRVALIELGTCLEGLLTEALGLPDDHKHTLGPLTDRAIKAGITIPLDISARFVAARNAAIHRGVDPSLNVVHDCMEIVDRLVKSMHPAFACDDDLPFGFRPQRYDFVLPHP